VAGLLVALLWDRLDPRARRPEELERLGLPVLGTVPASGDAGPGTSPDAAQAYAVVGARLRALGGSRATATPVLVLTPVDDGDVPLAAVAEALAEALAAD